MIHVHVQIGSELSSELIFDILPVQMKYLNSEQETFILHAQSVTNFDKINHKTLSYQSRFVNFKHSLTDAVIE